MKKWEYISICVRDPSGSKTTMNSMGLEGWELVTVTAESIDAYSIAYFKREIEEKK